MVSSVSPETIARMQAMRAEGATTVEISNATGYSVVAVRKYAPSSRKKARTITDEIAAEVKRLRDTGLSYVKIARQVDLSKHSVGLICHGKHKLAPKSVQVRDATPMPVREIFTPPVITVRFDTGAMLSESCGEGNTHAEALARLRASIDRQCRGRVVVSREEIIA